MITILCTSGQCLNEKKTQTSWVSLCKGYIIFYTNKTKPFCKYFISVSWRKIFKNKCIFLFHECVLLLIRIQARKIGTDFFITLYIFSHFFSKVLFFFLFKNKLNTLTYIILIKTFSKNQTACMCEQICSLAAYAQRSTPATSCTYTPCRHFVFALVWVYFGPIFKTRELARNLRFILQNELYFQIPYKISYRIAISYLLQIFCNGLKYLKNFKLAYCYFSKSQILSMIYAQKRVFWVFLL